MNEFIFYVYCSWSNIHRFFLPCSYALIFFTDVPVLNWLTAETVKLSDVTGVIECLFGLHGWKNWGVRKIKDCILGHLLTQWKIKPTEAVTEDFYFQISITVLMLWSSFLHRVKYVNLFCLIKSFSVWTVYFTVIFILLCHVCNLYILGVVAKGSGLESRKSPVQAPTITKVSLLGPWERPLSLQLIRFYTII